jgi:hypothetical protein
MELTKEQKLEVVKYAYEMWEEGLSKFMCINLRVSLKEVLQVRMHDSDDVPVYIPELLNYKPKKLYGEITWWSINKDGVEARDKAFQGSIKDLSPDKVKETF